MGSSYKHILFIAYCTLIKKKFFFKKGLLPCTGQMVMGIWLSNTLTVQT